MGWYRGYRRGRQTRSQFVSKSIGTPMSCDQVESTSSLSLEASAVLTAPTRLQAFNSVDSTKH
jgi:hypothetical protein